VSLHPQRFSRPPHSTALPPLRSNVYEGLRVMPGCVRCLLTAILTAIAAQPNSAAAISRAARAEAPAQRGCRGPTLCGVVGLASPRLTPRVCGRGIRGDVRIRGMLARAAIVALCILQTIALIGCDRSQNVKYVNETNEQITVYRYGRAYPEMSQGVGPGQTRTNTILANGGDDAHVATVEATDGNGELIFCHAYKVGELRELAGVIRIKRGQNDC
jgi:hypothetical protein